MSIRPLFNGLVVLALLLPALPAPSRVPMRSPAEPPGPLIVDKVAEGSNPHWHSEHSVDTPGRAGAGPFAEAAGSSPDTLSRLREFSASVVRSSPGAHTWDAGEDFAAGAFDYTEVVSGTDQVTLLRRWGANVRASDILSEVNQYNPSLATNDAGILYVTWGDQRNVYYDIYSAKSLDGGQNWSTGVRVNDDVATINHYNPSLAVGITGTLYVAWHDGRDGDSNVYYSKSVDGGETWSTDVRVNDYTGFDADAYSSLVVDDDGDLYIAWYSWECVPFSDCYGDIYLAKSTNGGMTWSPSVKVSDDASSAGKDAPYLAVGPDGTLYLVWEDGRNSSSYHDIYFARSTDEGQTWSTNAKVNDDTEMTARSTPCLAVDGDGGIYVAWSDSRDGWDIYFAKSTDGGESWSTNYRVNGDIGSADQRSPSLAVGGDRILYVAWSDDRNGWDDADIYCAKSTDRGDNWSANFRVNDDAGSVNQSSPSIVAGGGGNLAIAWTDERNGSYFDVYTAVWPDNAHVHTGGTYVADHDASDIVAWNSLIWTSTLPAGTGVTLAARVGNTPTVDVHWSDWVTFTTSPADLSALPVARYFQWRAALSSPISTTTPALDAVTVVWGGFDYTQVGGTLSGDASWTAAGSPYLAVGNVVVGQGVTLTIEPGATVWFHDTRALNVLGTLVAQGTATQPITFTSWHVKRQKDDWGAIAFAHTAVGASFDATGNYLGGSALMYSTVAYAGAGDFDYAVDAASTAVYVDSCAIRQNGAGGMRVGGTASHITNNEISDNTATDKGGGIYNTGDATIIRGNTITGNAAVDGGGIANDGSAAIIGHNTIEDNHASNEGGGIFSAQPSATIYGNTISNNGAGVQGGGICWEGNDGNIVYNTILANTSTGSAGGVYVRGGDNYPTVHYNTFQGNGGYALINDNDLNLSDPTHLNARYNWWGTTNEVSILDLIYDGLDNPDKSLVDYNPYLIEQPDLSPDGVNVNGRMAGLVNIGYSFDASVYPIAAMPPLTYTWQATGQAPVTHVDDDLHDMATFTWTTPGSQIITVTVRNSRGVTHATHTLTITEISAQDTYEADDVCVQARPITTTGTSQIHTFHSVDDVDWVLFPAASGTTYIIETVTPDDSEADVTLELYDACGGDLQDEQDNAFSPNVSLSFTAPQDGSLYLRLADNRDTAGGEAAVYYLSVRALPQTPPTGALILVAGKNKVDDTVQPNIYHVTNAVYRLFEANGYTTDDIYYLAPETSLDANGDGTPDVTQESTKSNLQNAITTWAAGKVHDANDTLTLYMMDHGGYDVFYLNYLDNQARTVSAYELDGWLDTLEAAAPGVQVNIVIEACQSGSFIDPPQSLSQLGRVVIASTGAYPLAYASQQGATFSDALVVALGQGMNLDSSFAQARWAVQQAHPTQTPWLDDNGDGIPNGERDGDLAVERGFATSFGAGAWPPYIARALVNQTMGRIEAEVRIEESKVISEVWALVYAPAYEPPESGEDLEQEDVPRVDLVDGDGDGTYEATYGFAENGMYRVVVYAVDDTGLNARPRKADREDGSKVYLPVVMRP